MPEHNDSLVLSFLTVRRALGMLGFALPIVLIAYGLIVNGQIEDSVSAFYYTGMGDVFVGTLCAIGVFLFAYKGYPPEPGERITDRRVSQIAGAGAIITALFPSLSANRPDCETMACAVTGFGPSSVHYVGAVAFFLAIAVFCLVLFTRTAPGTEPDAEKRRANAIYRSCGIVILLMLVGLAAIFLFVEDGSPLEARLDAINAVFWLETVAIFAFATAWLVKGQTLRAFLRLNLD